MRLLLTRADDDAARTRKWLEAAGHGVLVSPVIMIVPIPVAWPREAHEGVIATSARAFYTASAADLDGGLGRTVPLFCVGQRTLEAARRRGFAGPENVAPTSAALAAILAARAPGRVVYLTGRDRKPGIEETLAAAGYQLVVRETYAAEPAPSLAPDAAAALRAHAVDAVLHYSRRSATIFLGLCARAGIDAARAAHLCLSADVAAPLLAAGRGARVAASPDEAGMMELVTRTAAGS